MLFFRKNKHSLIRDYIEFLNSADVEYMRAFATRSLKALYTYMSKDCVVKLSAQIYSSGGRYFGAPNFRTTTWTVISESNGIYDICKNVEFDKIKFTKSIRMGVASDYRELWRLNTNNGLMVMDISKLV